jgi:hypothetical protein
MKGIETATKPTIRASTAIPNTTLTETADFKPLFLVKGIPEE